MDLELCWGAQAGERSWAGPASPARGCSYRRALQCLSLHSGSLQGALPGLSILRRDPSPLTSLQPRWAWAPPPPCAWASSPMVSPSSFLGGCRARCGEQGGGTQPPPPSLGVLPSPDLSSPSPRTWLCTVSALLPLPAKQRCGICPDGCMRGEPRRERQYLLLDQLRWFRKGDKLLGTRVLLSAHKQLFSSATSRAS